MRQIYFNSFSILMFLLIISSCVKENIPTRTSALTIVNGVVGNKSLLTSFKEPNSATTVYSLLPGISYGNFKFFNSYSGTQKLSLYQIPDTSLSSRPIFSLNLDLPVNTIHTLFLTGTPQLPEYLTTLDELPNHMVQDSTMGIRFVNLSKDNPTVSVNLTGKANGSETENLSYKSVTAFKKYNASSAISSYTFEFRDKATGVLLGTCKLDGINAKGTTTPNIMRNRNFTLALLGASANSAPNKVLRIDANIKQ